VAEILPQAVASAPHTARIPPGPPPRGAPSPTPAEGGGTAESILNNHSVMNALGGQLLGLALLAAVAAPAPAERVDLAGAMARGRAQALAVTAAGDRAEAARERWREARGFRLPTVRLDELWIRTDSPAEAFAFRLNQERFSFADFVAGEPNAPPAISTGLTRLELELPLYTGGELAGRVEQARLAAAAARQSADWAAHGAALAAAEAYVRLAQAGEQAALVASSRDTVAAHVRLAAAMVEQGMLVRSELLRAEVELARLEDLLAAARAQEQVAAASLAFHLGADPAARFEIEPLPAAVEAPGALAGWLAAAAERADVAAARQALAAGRLEEKVRRAAALPRVGLLARRDWVDDSPFGRHGDSTTVMATARLELFAGGRHRAAVDAARAEAAAGAQDVESLARAARLQVEQAWAEADAAAARQRTAVQALAAARESERILGERFRSGVVRTIDWLDATTARLEAETRELVARAEAQLGRLRLALHAGRAPESALQP